MTLYSFDNAVPAANDNPSSDQPDMLTNNQSTLGIIGEDHITFNLNNGGQHKAIRFNQDASYVPTPPVSPPELFTNTVLGLPQLFYYSGDAAHSSTQYVASTNGSTLLLGGLIIKWGVATAIAGGQVVTFVSPFPNNCFVVVATSIDPALSSGIASTNITTSSFKANRTSGSGVVGINYIAIGN